MKLLRVKISYKDPTKIPGERLLGINGKIYRFPIEVEPTRTAEETAASTNPTSEIQLPMDTEPRDNTDDVGSQKGSRTGSKNGSAIGSGTTNTRNQSLGHNHQAGEATPTSMLKSQLP